MNTKDAETNRKKPLRLLCILCALCVVLSLAPAVYAQTPNEELEREAQAIDKMLMCPVCPAETIDQAQVEISFQMRSVVRELLAEGRTREEVLDYFVDRYGADILAAPPKSGTNLVAWILPIVGVAAGLLGVFLVIRAMTRAQRSVPLPSRAPAAANAPGPQAPGDPDLAPYLEIADRIIGSRRASARPALVPQADAPTLSADPDGESRTSPQRGDTSG